MTAARRAKKSVHHGTLRWLSPLGWGYYALMKRHTSHANTGVWALVIIISCIVSSRFVMWMGEQITEFGIGSSISIMFAGILSRVPLWCPP